MGSCSQEKEVGDAQHNIQTEFITPSRTARRSPSQMRESKEQITNSFQALLENEIVDMVSHENWVVLAPHG